MRKLRIAESQKTICHLSLNVILFAPAQTKVSAHYFKEFNFSKKLNSWKKIDPIYFPGMEPASTATIPTRL